MTFHMERSQALDFEPERVCQRCETRRLLVLFPRTQRGFYSKVCQLCTTIEADRERAVLRARRSKRIGNSLGTAAVKLVPLREKLKCGP
jgi:hypothetical protein